MRTIEEMKQQKKQLGYTNQKIAEETGIPLGTVQKIFAGVTKAPRWDKMQALDHFFTEAETAGRKPFGDWNGKRGAHPGNAYLEDSVYGKNGEHGQTGAYREDDEYGQDSEYGENSRMNCVREQIAYDCSVYDDRDPTVGNDPRQGHYTVDDYLAVPDDRRVELIDGFLYDMASPSWLHQAILRELTAQFYACLENHPECELLFAPADVQLGKNRRTVVQPDLFIICNRKKPDNDMLREAPDFILEIVSPSNPENDKFRKLNKYRFSGVREYWIVDPQSLKITVYNLEQDKDPELYEFTSVISVGISEGKCSIDFAKITKRVEKYLKV